MRFLSCHVFMEVDDKANFMICQKFRIGDEKKNDHKKLRWTMYVLIEHL